MTEKSENKMDTLPDLDDLLQCPVCYEIPSGQIFQCNEGHHVCGRCKMRLDVCPVCRAFFFGTRNYAMEELIANVRKLQAFKLGGKVTTGSPPPEDTSETRESSSENTELTTANDNNDDVSTGDSARHPSACKGLFRCLCCKKNPERLPIARLLNHLRYFHSPGLIESRSENGGYLQAWQFPTSPGRMVTAVRVHDMGIFFLIIEVKRDSVHAWMSMAASPWVAHEFSYTFTLSGNDREAIFSDCVWSVRACEGSLKKQGRCLAVTGADARALVTPTTMSGKLSVRRTPHEMQPHVARPRAVLRVATRSNAPRDEPAAVTHDLEPFLQDLQDDVARLSRAFATLGREANALVRSEAQMRARLGSAPPSRWVGADAAAAVVAPEEPPQPAVEGTERHLSRSARRRMRQRLRQAFMESQADGAGNDRVAGPAPRPVTAAVAAPAVNRSDYEAASVSRPASTRNVGDHARAGNARSAVNATRPDSNRNAISRPLNNQVSNNVPGLTHNGQTVRINRTADDPNVNAVGRTGTGHIYIVRRPPVANEARSINLSPSEIFNLSIAEREHAAASGAPPPTLGEPSGDRPANRNARIKKKRRLRRYNL